MTDKPTPEPTPEDHTLVTALFESADKSALWVDDESDRLVLARFIARVRHEERQKAAAEC